MCSPSGRERRAAAALALLLAAGVLAQDPAGPPDGLRLQIRKEELAYRLARTPAARERARERLAELLVGAEDPALRARGLRLKLDADPDDPMIQRELAEVAVELGRTLVARRLFEEVVAANPQDVAARLGLAYLYEDLGLPGQAGLEFEEVLARDPENREALLGAAGAWMTRNRPGPALKRLERLLALDPGNREALRMRREARQEIASGLSGGGEEDEERTPAEVAQRLSASLQEALAEGRDGFPERRALAAALLRADRPGQARGHYLELVEARPGEAEFLLGLSRSHRELGDLSGARLYAERAERLRPDGWEVALELARILDAEGRGAAAGRAFEEAHRLDRTRIEPLLERGLFELSRGRPKQAVEWLRRAAAVDPEDPTSLAALASARFELGDRAGAEVALSDARRRDPREPLGWKLLARMEAEAGNVREAAGAWREYLFLDPLSVEGWLALGRLRAAANDLPGAAQALDVALSLDPQDREVVEALDGVLARLPFRAETEDTRLLLKERLARLAQQEGKIEDAVRLFETVAEDRARQIRRERAAVGELAPEQARERRAALRRLLGDTRAKVRVHRRLAELYLDLERDDHVEDQYRELHALDPGAAEYVRELAVFYAERDRNQDAVAWFRKLPGDARLDLEQKLLRAEALDATGREEQAERALREARATEHRDDAIEAGLADHAARKGNLFAAERHARRAYTLFGGNQPSLELVRSVGKGETPDWWTEFFRYADSDGIEIQQVLYGRRVELSPRTLLAGTVSRFEVEDAFTPEQDDIGGQVMVRHELSERARISSTVGFVRFGVQDDLAWDLRLDYHPDDEWALWARLSRDSVNETPLASTRGFEETRLHLDATWFAHHRWRLQGFYETSNITGGNDRTAWNLDLAVRPLGRVLPGWLHFARGNLDFSRRVAPALYFAPEDLDRSDVYYELLEGVGEDVFVRVILGLHRDFDFARTKHAAVSLLADVGPKGRVSVDYGNWNRSRSYHDFSRGQDAEELTVAYNAEF